MSEPVYIRAEDLEFKDPMGDFWRAIEERDRAVLNAMDDALWHDILFGPAKPQESAAKRLVASACELLGRIHLRVIHTLIRLSHIG